MSNSTQTVIADATNATAFRLWVASVIAGLTACGLTQTSDTGQINTATVAAPGGVSTSMGYAIFRFNDTLQATKPIYMKFEFGSGSGAAARPGMWLTMGTATDGAGTVSGTAILARTALGSGSATGTVAIDSHFSYDSTIGCFWMNARGNVTNNNWYLFIHRTCDSSENPTGDGLVFTWHASSAGWTSFRYDTGATKTLFGVYGGPWNTGSTDTMRTPTATAVWACWTFINAIYTLPGFVGVYQNDWQAWSNFSATLGTTTRTYKALCGSNDSTTHAAGADVEARLAGVW